MSARLRRAVLGRLERLLAGLRSVGHTLAGRRVLRAVLRSPMVAPPTRTERRRVRRYARRVLGSVRYRYWLLVYAAHHGSFREGWIPDDFFAARILPVVNTSYRNLSDARSLTRRILGATEVPDVAYLLHGHWFDVDMRPIDLAEVVRRCFVDDPDGVIVLKAESSNQGRGVTVLDRAALSALDPRALRTAVVQRMVRQHPDLARIVPDCTATVRITTVRAGATVRTVAAYLRLGRTGERSVRSATQVRVPVVGPDGSLAAVATAGDWTQHEVHPDTGFRFAGAVVPAFADLIATCERLHARAPQFTVVGWDVVPEADGGVAVLEWNTDHPDIKFTEATFGPGFAGLGFEAL